MKRTIITFVLALSALFMTQCRKNIEQIPVTTMRVSANISTDCSKTSISTVGGVEWKYGDKIHVVGEIEGYLGDIVAQSNGNPVLFDGEITAITVAQKFHYYYTGNRKFNNESIKDDKYTFDISSQTGDLNDIANNQHLMCGVSSENISIGETDLGSFAMSNMMSIVKMKFIRDDGETFQSEMTCGGAFASVKLNVKDGSFDNTTKSVGGISMTNVASNTYYYIALIPGVQTLSFSQGMAAVQLAEKEVVQNMFYYIDEAVAMHTTLPAEALKGKFSVSADEKVVFAKGNIYYDNSETAWKFEDYQCDFRTYSSKTSVINEQWSSTGTPKNDWGTFGWSTSKTDYGKSTSQTDSDYSGDFKDWGENFGDVWFTLSMSQWDYLLNTRTNASDLRRIKNIKINSGSKDLLGLILLPDGTQDPATAFDNITQNSDLATYDAVFLPAAGDRTGSAPGNQNTTGFYWTSTLYDATSAMRIKFTTEDGFENGKGGRIYGRAVRLACYTEGYNSIDDFNPVVW